MTNNNNQPVKILEISGQSWCKGIAIQPYIPVGGLFQTATNFDPFQRIGRHFPTEGVVVIGNGVVLNSVEFFAPAIQPATNTVAAIGLIYGFANNSKVYRITQSTTPTVADVSNEISDIKSIRGAVTWRNRIIYASATRVVSGSIPLSLSAATTLLTGLMQTTAIAGGPVDHILKEGPDGNLYVTNGNKLARITNALGSAGNDAAYRIAVAGTTYRDLDNDGKYLVMLRDENPTASTYAGNLNSLFKSQVRFWNCKSTDDSRIWEFRDRLTKGIEVLEDDVVIVGTNNIYSCSIDSAIKPIMPLLPETEANLSITGAAAFDAPSTTRSIIKGGDGIILFGGGTGVLAGARIMAYGRPYPGLDKVFYQPYTFDIATKAIAGLYWDGRYLYGGNQGSKLYVRKGGAGLTSTMVLAGVDFKNPYEFSFARVVLDTPMSSGQAIKMRITTANNNRTVMNIQSFNFASSGTTVVNLFYPNPIGTSKAGSIPDIPMFEDLSDITISNNGATISKVEIWGRPQRADQTTY